MEVAGRTRDVPTTHIYISELQPGGISMIKSLLGGLLAATHSCMLSSTAMRRARRSSPGRPRRPTASRRGPRDTKFFQYPAKKGPYRIALANGYIANTWRIQMIKTAKAYAAQPDVAAKLKEFKVVSTGEDVAGADRGDQQLHRFRL